MESGHSTTPGHLTTAEDVTPEPGSEPDWMAMTAAQIYDWMAAKGKGYKRGHLANA
jgi:hypothetical protein